MDSGSEGLNLSPVFAPIYWGFVISLFLGGMTIVQAYIYFPSPGDRLAVRLTATSMLILDMVSSALTAQSIYYYLIPRFGSLAPLSSITPELSAECLLSTIITAISQMYFVYQLVNVRKASQGSSIFIGAIAFFTLIAFAGGVACVGAMYKFHHGVLSNRNIVFAIGFGIAKGAGALTDILATIAMCMFLSFSKTGMNETNGVLRTLVQFVIHRGALVTLVQVMLLITFYAIPNNLAWFAFHVNVTKLYANTFFAMLNGRSTLKEKISSNSNSKQLNISSFGNSGSYQMQRSHRSGNNTRSVDDFEQMGRHTKSNRSMDMPIITKSVIISEL